LKPCFQDFIHQPEIVFEFEFSFSNPSIIEPVHQQSPTTAHYVQMAGDCKIQLDRALLYQQNTRLNKKKL